MKEPETSEDRLSSLGWALVLGASSGFGAAVSRRLALDGFDICGVHLDRRSTVAGAEEVRRAVEDAGRQALFFNVNAAADDKRDEVLDRLREHGGTGSLRLLFHSIAFGSMAPLVGEQPKGSARRSQVEMTLDVMASTLVYWTQGVLWRDLMGDGGRILAMSSAGSQRVTAGYGMVSAAKAALESYVRQLAFELAPKGIAVNTIRAGVTRTAALEKIPGWEGLIERARSINPGGRTTTTEDVANAVSLLVRPEAAWLTGNVLGVDGGEDIVG